MNQGPRVGMQPMQHGPTNIAPTPYAQPSAQMQAAWSMGGPQPQAPWQAAQSYQSAGGAPVQAQPLYALPQPQPLYTEQRQGQASIMPALPPAAGYNPAQPLPPLHSGQMPSTMPPMPAKQEQAR